MKPNTEPNPNPNPNPNSNPDHNPNPNPNRNPNLEAISFLESMDIDGDGFINLQEFHAYFGSHIEDGTNHGPDEEDEEAIEESRESLLMIKDAWEHDDERQEGMHVRDASPTHPNRLSAPLHQDSNARGWG